MAKKKAELILETDLELKYLTWMYNKLIIRTFRIQFANLQDKSVLKFQEEYKKETGLEIPKKYL